MPSAARSEIIRRLTARYIADRCHPEQRAFVEDDSDRVLALCGRRSGKTDGIAARLLLAALRHPYHAAVYITLTRSRARDLCGAALEKIERNLGIGLREYTRDGNLYWTLPNAGKILLTGCSDKLECEKFRGDARSEVAIDEADSMRPYLEYLACDCIQPSLLDLRGKLVLGGTPGPTLLGYFHQASTDKSLGWSTHHWTVLQNPHLPHAGDWIDTERSRMSRARFTREIMGIWETDAESLIFNYIPEVNACSSDQLPPLGNWRTIIGIDYGHNHPCAWAVWKYRQGYPECYLVKTIKKSGLTPSQAAEFTFKLRNQYDNARLVGDAGGTGRGYISEFTTRYHVPIEPAAKLHRGQHLALFSGEVKSGQVKIDPIGCRDLLDEWAVLTWDTSGEDSQDGLPDDCTDASMYGLVAIMPNSAQLNKDRERAEWAALTPAERAQKEEDKLFEAAKKEGLKRQRQGYQRR